VASARDHVPLSPRPELAFPERIRTLEEAFSGRLGYHAVHLEQGTELELRADERFSTASVIKVALVCCVLDLVARGVLDLHEHVGLPPRADRVAGGGILKQLDVEHLSLRDLVELTLVLSDNVATNALYERCGGSGEINGYLDGLGFAETRMPGPVDFAAITNDSGGGIGVSTPREQTSLLTALVRDEVLTPELCAYVRGVLGRQHFLDQLPRWLGWNTYAQYHGRDWPLWVGNKTGELDGIRADAGVVRSQHGTVVIAIFSDGGRDLRETVDCEGSLAVAECGAAICAHLLDLDC
jgi:beta-lactamase class A